MKKGQRSKRSPSLLLVVSSKWMRGLLLVLLRTEVRFCELFQSSNNNKQSPKSSRPIGFSLPLWFNDKEHQGGGGGCRGDSLLAFLFHVLSPPSYPRGMCNTHTHKGGCVRCRLGSIQNTLFAKTTRKSKSAARAIGQFGTA